MLLYLITYDISDNRRRKKVADLLEGYGKRVQYSVFECVLPAPKYRELCQRLRRVVKADLDSLRFYPVSAHTLDRVEVWGGAPVTQPPDSIVI